jgi:hypothetical protein
LSGLNEHFGLSTSVCDTLYFQKLVESNGCHRFLICGSLGRRLACGACQIVAVAPGNLDGNEVADVDAAA